MGQHEQNDSKILSVFCCYFNSEGGQHAPVYVDRIWIEESDIKISYDTAPRIGIDYAGEPWKSKQWRFFITQSTTPDL